MTTDKTIEKVYYNHRELVHNEEVAYYYCPVCEERNKLADMPRYIVGNCSKNEYGELSKIKSKNHTILVETDDLESRVYVPIINCKKCKAELEFQEDAIINLIEAGLSYPTKGKANAFDLILSEIHFGIEALAEGQAREAEIREIIGEDAKVDYRKTFRNTADDGLDSSIDEPDEDVDNDEEDEEDFEDFDISKALGF